jgi:tRNA (guanine37-N1)-methyltransferase
MGLKRQLAGIVPEPALQHLSDHFDVIGDVAVLAVPEDLGPYKQAIAETIVMGRRNIYTVLNKVEKVAGDARTAQYEVLRGDTTVTVHREFGFSYRLDVRRSFFSPRMAYERKRVTDQVEPGERVYVPFAGVGPYAIPAAAHGADVTAVELNPDAFQWLKENIRLNHRDDNCHAIEGDATDTRNLPSCRFDRIIIPAPYGMDHVLEIFLPLVTEGGMVHFYTFKTEEQVPGLVAAYEKKGLTVTNYLPCGNVAPGVSRWVFDLAYPLRP